MEFRVERILKRKVSGMYVYYLVKRQGCSMEESTWEPVHNLKGASGIIRQFNRRQKRMAGSMSMRRRYNVRHRQNMGYVKKLRSYGLVDQNRSQACTTEGIGRLTEQNGEKALRKTSKSRLKPAESNTEAKVDEKVSIKVQLKASVRREVGNQSKNSENMSEMLKLQDIWPSDSKRAMKIYEHDLKVLSLGLDTSGVYYYNVTSHQGDERLSQLQLIQRNHMALINYYESMISQ